MKKNNVIIVSLSVAAIVLLGSTITLGTLYGISLNDEEEAQISNPYQNFEYVDGNKIKTGEVIDFSVSNYKLSNTAVNDFNNSNLRILSTEYWNSAGVSNTFINPFSDEIFNLNYNSLITPYYGDDNELQMFVSGTNQTDSGSAAVKHWSKNGITETNEINAYDHEIFRYKDHDYILNGSNILVTDSDNEKFTFSHSQNLGMPIINADGHMVSGTLTHFNSFDIYGENLLLNSRDMGTIFSLKILNEDGTIKDSEDFELNWVLPGNPIVPYYLEADDSGQNPVKWNEDYDSTVDVKYHQYLDNELYEPHFISDWEGKTLDVIVGDKTYDLENVEDAKELNMLSNDGKFWGEHTVRVVNTFLDSIASNVEGYDPDKLYVSIHDNHFPSEGVYYNNNADLTAPEGSSDVAWGRDAYSYHDDQASTIEMFGDNPYNPDEDLKSFTKIFEIDEDAGTVKLVLNTNNSVEGSEIDQFSDYRSSSTFFSINGNPYLITESSMNSSFALWEFDGIDFDTKTLINPVNLMDIQWDGEAGGYMHYRTYPIFGDLNNSVYGWNALNKNPYNG